MRVNPEKILNFITIFCSIFGVLALVIAILTGNYFVRAGAAVVMFFTGWAVAKIHSRL